MESCYEPSQGVSARVEVEVLGDRELYATVEDFARDASEQTTSSFDVLSFTAEGSPGTIRTNIRRRPKPGVTLSVADRPGASWAKDPLETVAAAVSRGALQWRFLERWPLLGKLTNYVATTDAAATPGTAMQDALAQRARSRATASWAWTSLTLALVLMVAYTVGWPAWEAEPGAIALWLAGIAVFAVAAGRVPVVQRAVLPAVEIAAKTPGRRQLARAAFVVGPISGLLLRNLS